MAEQTVSLVERLRRYAEELTLRDECADSVLVREAASRLAEGTRELPGDSEVRLMRAVQFVRENPVTAAQWGLDTAVNIATAVSRQSTPPASPAATSGPEHCCGVRGFAESGDDCPGCVASGRVSAASRPAQTWQPIESAPKDGTAVLGFGLHSGPQPDAQRGVKAGDHWWAIMLWDMWRNPDPKGWGEQSLWVFAKDGKPTWSRPTHWMPLPAPPGPGTQEQAQLSNSADPLRKE